MPFESRLPRALRILLALACSVVLVAGLGAAREVFLPLLLAAFLVLLGQAPVVWLRDRGVPGVLAAVLVGAATASLLAGVGMAFVSSLLEFKQEAPRFRELLRQASESMRAQLQRLGVDLPELAWGPAESGWWLEVASGALSHLAQGVSFALVVLVLVLFGLIEASDFRGKLRHLAGDGGASARLRLSCLEVRRYVAVKSLMCVLTGLGVGIIFVVADVRFAVLWAILAFLCNYIPVVGSILVAVPPLVLTWLEHGPMTAAVVGSSYVAVNLAISNILEPLLMGRRLGLSPLVVFSSLLFWGWLWGPIGMLLAVPLTTIAKILMENTDELRWAGVLMGRPSTDRFAPVGSVPSVSSTGESSSLSRRSRSPQDS